MLSSLTGIIRLGLTGKNFPSLEDFQQHSQRIRLLDYNTKSATAEADNIVSSVKKNCLIFPTLYQDTRYNKIEKYVYITCII